MYKKNVCILLFIAFAFYLSCFLFPISFPVSHIYPSCPPHSRFLLTLKMQTVIMRQQAVCWGVCEGVSFGRSAEGGVGGGLNEMMQ